MTRKRNPEKDVVISSASAAAAAARPRRASTATRTPRSRPTESPAAPARAPEVQVQTTTFVAEQALSHEEIARLAYAMWEAQGCLHGNSDEDWRRAEEELRRRALDTLS